MPLACCCGLSPRMQGKQVPRPLVRVALGSIPAYAGQTSGGWRNSNVAQVYPRVCRANAQRGMSGVWGIGLSPRMQGKLLGYGYRHGILWSIPAYAGQTNAGRVFSGTAGVYPRVCRANSILAAIAKVSVGLSPRMQGKQNQGMEDMLDDRSIPAYAGQTHACGCGSPTGAVYPRVCRANPARPGPEVSSDGLSPRMQGKPGHVLLSGPEQRSIPAYAGQTTPVCAITSQMRVYPRVCRANG